MLARSRSRFRGRVQAASFLADMAQYGATDVWDFTTQQYIRGGLVGGSGITFTRASAGYAQRLDGIWQSFGSGVARITDRGLLVEGSRINRALYSRDLTNPAWTATNVTVARNQVGIDGTANSACSLTATAGNGTVLQAVTHVSTARYFSIWVKRITGTGTVNVTLDNGSTWTAVTVTSDWTRVGAAQTLANPTVGVRLVTDTDAIAVDFAQLEDGAFPTSPILVEGTAVTRAADAATAGYTTNYPVTILAECIRDIDTGGNEQLLQLDNGGSSNRIRTFVANNDIFNAVMISGGANTASQTIAGAVSVGATTKIAVRAQVDNFRAAKNGALSSLVSSCAVPAFAPTTLRFGADTGGVFTNSYFQKAALFPIGLLDTQLQAVTT